MVKLHQHMREKIALRQSRCTGTTIYGT